MKNEEIAATFESIAQLLEIKGEVIYKILSYRRAAESIRVLGRDLDDVRREEGLKSIPGVGTAIAAKIEELQDTGSLDFYNQLLEEVPAGLLDVIAVRDVGSKSAARFWKELDVTNLDELEQAARAGRIKAMPGMGERTEARLLENIAEHRRLATGRLLLDEADRAAEEMLAVVLALPGVKRAAVAGSLRRRRETIGDLDMVASAEEPGAALQAFIQSPDILKVFSRGESKASVILPTGVRAQLWMYPPGEFGSALQFTTGSQAHNVRLRELAQKQALSLSEHGFKREDGSILSCAAEEDVYRAVGLDWIPPELREDRGEFTQELPGLISVEDLRADLHMHTTWSDGRHSLEEMVDGALNAGLRILAVTDHSRSLGVAGGLSIQQWDAQHVEVERLQDKFQGRLRILHGAEVEILPDGSLDFPGDVLARMDLVIASLHAGMHQPGDAATERILKALEDPWIDILAHPTGRLLGRREGMQLDMEAIFRSAAQRRIALEINAHPERLDLNDILARRAVELGCLLAINSDAHSQDQFAHLRYGISMARRGWVAPAAVVNTWPEAELLAWLGRKHG
ncbi:MAG: DNA polymerase/3'-5' exonuclease PolX [Anaerolineales bacterium]|nr:DNA polymerase/3'-5' exonuclease PolX [Anaerolineales bacterium]